MTHNSHIVVGLLISATTGEPISALTGAFLPDIDHLPYFYQQSLLTKPRALIATMLSGHDPGGDQRGFLHNLGIVTLPLFLFIVSAQPQLRAFAIAFTSHLILDMLDASDYYPFYPNKKIKLNGPIPYNSIYEVIFSIGITALFFLIFYP